VTAYWITEQSDRDRFWSKVDVGTPEECWPWTGSRNELGYGSFRSAGGRQGRTIKAHRLAFVLAHGSPLELAPADFVCHHCDNPSCCNPAHLYLGDVRTNTDDKVTRGRQAKGPTHGAAVSANSRRGDEHWTRRMPERLATRAPRRKP
jgi:hypothetical protein